MTEAEWLACREPEAMLRFAARYTSRRKEALFAVACCRRIGHLLGEYECELLVRVEESADRPLSVAEREALINDAMAHADGLSYQMGTPAGSARWLAANAVWYAAEGQPVTAADDAADAVTTSKCEPVTHDVAAPAPPTVADAGELAAQADLLRHIVGNPFRPVALDPAWLTSDVLALARGIYDERAFDRMPILADALQDAGCGSYELLSHLREPGEHVRGCWALDLLLGKG